MSGDYGRFQPIYGMSIVDTDLPIVPTALITAKSPARTVCVQKVVFVPSVYVASVLSFVDSVTGVSIGSFSIPANQQTLGDGSDTFVLDFGPTGTKLSLGANLTFTVTANGAAGRLHIEAYQKGPISVVVPNIRNS